MLTSEMYENSERLLRQAKEKDETVPVRIDTELDGVALNDSFQWNGNAGPEEMTEFAEGMCRDLKLDENFAPLIVDSIKEHVKNSQTMATLAAGMETKSLLQGTRIAVRLNVNVGNVCLIDQIEWDIGSPLSDANEFAQHLCSELGLGGKFPTVIAHNIREQVEFHRRTVISQAFTKRSTRMVPDGFEILPPVGSVIRGRLEQDEYCPFVQTYDDEKQLHALVQKEMRNVRRMRRGLSDILMDTSVETSSGRRGRRSTRMAADFREPLGSPDATPARSKRRSGRTKLGVSY